MKLFFGFLTVVALSLSFPGSVHSEQENKPLTIGVIIPLTGDAASLGNAFKNGVELALAELPANERRLVQVRYEDDTLNAGKSVTALSKLITQDNVDVVVGFSSAASNALAPIIEKQRIPMLAIASDTQIVKGRRYAFNFWVTPEEEARALLSEIKRRGYKKVARITTIHQGTAAVNGALAQINHGDVSFTLDEEVGQDGRDFRNFLAKLKRAGDIEAIHPILFPGQLSAFAIQVRAMGITLPMFGWEFFEDAKEINTANGALLGAWYVNADDAAGDFNARYLKKFPNASLYSAPNGYDTVMLVVAAARIDPSREGVRNFLSTLKNFSGALGEYSASGDNRFTLPAAVKLITVDGFKKIT